MIICWSFGGYNSVPGKNLLWQKCRNHCALISIPGYITKSQAVSLVIKALSCIHYASF